MESKASTQKQYRKIQEVFDFLNVRLFAGQLPDCLITLHRHAKAKGYFCAERFSDTNGTNTRIDEIALNPDLFDRPEKEILGTLAHEMVHLWQEHFGKAPRRSYHNAEFARKMEEIGLITSDTGEFDGKRTGQRVTHYILEGGKFDRLMSDFLTQRKIIDWKSIPNQTQTRRKKNKVKYTCPSCGNNVWGKPDLNILCGDCHERFQEEE